MASCIEMLVKSYSSCFVYTHHIDKLRISCRGLKHITPRSVPHKLLKCQYSIQTQSRMNSSMPKHDTSYMFSLGTTKQFPKFKVSKFLSCSKRNTRSFDFRCYTSKAASTLSLENPKLILYLEEQVSKYTAAMNCLLDSSQQTEDALKVANLVQHRLHPLVTAYTEYLTLRAEVDELDKILAEEDKEMRDIAEEEKQQLLETIEEQEGSVLYQLLPEELGDDKSVVLEVSAGVGGVEAMIFTGEIFHMYEQYAQYRGWTFEIEDIECGEAITKNVIRRASAVISGDSVYKSLKYEGGVHRVQRVPKTEKSGRVHTSTMTVAILPKATEIDVVLLPRDLEITSCRASGAGGQHVNTTDSAVRIVHKPTGIAAECQKGRSQIMNKELALDILRSKLYEIELEKQSSDIKSRRKLQVGARGRSEKIRTYNFSQDRITDHRVSGNLFNLDRFLSGGDALDELIDELQEEALRERLLERLEEWEAKPR